MLIIPAVDFQWRTIRAQWKWLRLSLGDAVIRSFSPLSLVTLSMRISEHIYFNFCVKLITAQETNSGTSHSHLVLSTNKCWRASFWIQLLPLITPISMNKWKLVCIFSLIISLIYISVMRPVLYPLAWIKRYPAECRTVQTCWLRSSCSPPLVLNVD